MTCNEFSRLLGLLRGLYGAATMVPVPLIVLGALLLAAWLVVGVYCYTNTDDGGYGGWT